MLKELIDKMIPGDIEKKLPRFSDILTLQDSLISCSLIDELQLLLEQKHDLPQEEDITVLLKWLRKQNYAATKNLELKVLEAYFSHPEVIRKLYNGKSTLFPHQRFLPEIEVELLEPVMHLDKRKFSDGQ
jgi:hypothetical protein